MPEVSVLILTKNEEINIERCIRSVSWSDDIVVLDSYSDDRTVELAESFGARVIQRKFDNYAGQRNAALLLDFKYEWILMLDADECVCPELVFEIGTVLKDIPDSVTVFQMRRKDFFFDCWIKHASAYPTWFERLIRKGRGNFEREINEHYHTDGDVRILQGHLLHYPFSKGIAYWFERHNRYSSVEADALIGEVLEKFLIKSVFSFSPQIRRSALKQLAYRLSGRPVLVFLYLYLFRLGFLDGLPGFRYSVMRSMYEYMIDLKVAEKRFNADSLGR